MCTELQKDVVNVNTASVEDFKQAMRRLAATVTIITAYHEGDRCGMVATAVSSVSTDPPSLVVGINRASSVHRAIQQSRHFSVNLLSTYHTDLVYPFSGKLQGEERFTLGQWHDHLTRVPFLSDAPVNLFCEVDAQLDYGSHTLFVGIVRDIHLNTDAQPLLWKDGSLAAVVPLDTLMK